MLSTAKEIEDKLQILYQDKPVKNLYLIVIKLINSGNTPIRHNDYESPIILTFSPNTQILEADIIETLPDNLKAKIKVVDNKATIAPILLNAADSITIKIITDFDSFIKAEARIYGIKEIVYKDTKDRKTNVLLFVFGLLSGGFFLICLLGFVVWLLSER